MAARDGKSSLSSLPSLPSLHEGGSAWAKDTVGQRGRKPHAHEAVPAEPSHHDRLASLGSVIAGVAHELSSPAAFVMSNLAVLARYTERLLNYIEKIEAAAPAEAKAQLRKELEVDRIASDLTSLLEGTRDGAERIHAQVLNLSRYAMPQRDDVRRYDLCATVRTAVQWVRQTAGRPLPVQFRMPAELALVGHGNAVHQILINLLQNAVDAVAGQSEARLNVSVAAVDGGAVVEVHDNGPGLGDGDPRRLFEPFVTSKAAGEGTGLGLSLSLSLAHREGGKLDAANHPDGGAVFTLCLPSTS